MSFIRVTLRSSERCELVKHNQSKENSKLDDIVEIKFLDTTENPCIRLRSRDGRRMHATKAELEHYSRAGRGWLVSTDLEGGVPGREKTFLDSSILLELIIHSAVF